MWQRVFGQSWRISVLAIKGLRDVELSERDSRLFVTPVWHKQKRWGTLVTHLTLRYSSPTIYLYRFISFWSFLPLWSVYHLYFNFKRHVTSMSSEIETAIWPRDTGQRILWFDRCQLIVAWMSNIKEVHGKPRLYVSVKQLLGVWPPCCATASSSSSSIERTCPRAIPPGMIAMRKSAHASPSLFYTCLNMGLRSEKAHEEKPNGLLTCGPWGRRV